MDAQALVEITAAWQRACISFRKDLAEVKLLRHDSATKMPSSDLKPNLLEARLRLVPSKRRAVFTQPRKVTPLEPGAPKRQACLDLLFQLARQTGSANLNASKAVTIISIHMFCLKGIPFLTLGFPKPPSFASPFPVPALRCWTGRVGQGVESLGAHDTA